MNVQFGRWNFDGQPADPAFVARVRTTVASYSLIDAHTYSKGGTQILYFPFPTTKESIEELQPHTSASGEVFTWDGRLDNRTQLVRELGSSVESRCSDVQIVAAAFAKWNTACFPRLLGDWALSIW